MKRLFAITLLALALVSCKKELEPITQQEVGTENVSSEGRIKLNLSISDKADSNTKAVKQGWEDGDKIYLFFTYRVNGIFGSIAVACSKIFITYTAGQWVVGDEHEQEVLDYIGESVLTDMEASIYAIYVEGDRTLTRIDDADSVVFSFGEAVHNNEVYAEIQEAPNTPFTIDNNTLSASLQFSQVCTQVVVTNIDANDAWRLASPNNISVGFTRFRGIKELKVVGYNSKNLSFYDNNIAFGVPNDDGAAFYLADIRNTSKPVYVILTNTINQREYCKLFPEGRSLQLGKAYKLIGPELDASGDFINDNGWEYAEFSNKILYTKTSPEAELSLSLIDGDCYETFGANMTKWTYYEDANYGEIIFDNWVTKVANHTFQDQLTLQTITLPDSVQEIGNEAFSGCTNLQKINIPRLVTKIGAYAFYGCSSLQEVIIHRGVTTIISRAFESCTNLQKIELPEGLREIQDFAFNNCTSLSEITFPESLTRIGYQSFMGCAFTSITIPKNVVTIEGSAFLKCAHLERFYCQATTPPSILDSSSLGSPQLIIVPNGSVDTYRNAPKWSKYADKIFDLSNLSYIYYTTTDGQAHNPNGADLRTKIYSNTYENNQGVITLLSNSTTIERYTYFSCDFLTSITLPEGISTIGESAFYNCYNLTSITLPESVSSIGASAFKYCGSLTSIYCKNPTPPSLGVDVFEVIHPSAKIYVPSESVDAYKSAEGWSTYSDMIVAGDF